VRIAYSCHNSFPSFHTNTQQVFWTTLEAARLGVAITLFIPSLDVPDSEDQRTTIASYYGLEGNLPATLAISVAGTRSLAWPPAQSLFDWRIARRVRHGRFDLVWTRDPVALLSCLRAGVPALFETYRLDLATQKRFAFWRRMALNDPKLLGVVAHSRLTADAFLEAGVRADRCLVAHNGFPSSLMNGQPPGQSAARAHLGLPIDRALVVYAGHADRRKGLDVLVRMAARVPAADFLVVGATPESNDAAALLAAARAAGSTNFFVRSWVPPADVGTYLYAADCLIVPPATDPLHPSRRTVLPMKVFTYLAAGRPILAPRSPDIEEVLTDGHTALLVEAGDADAAAAALERLLRDSALRERLAQGARRAAGAYTWRARAQKIVSFLEGKTGERAGESRGAARVKEGRA
jgi:glycosyltransferase involved in cell wall biosynthesis